MSAAGGSTAAGRGKGGTPRPNLFVIGAMKSGTSSLHAYLGAHPAVFMSDPKEPSHFVGREHRREAACRSEEEYLSLTHSAAECNISLIVQATELPKAHGDVESSAIARCSGLDATSPGVKSVLPTSLAYKNERK